MTLTANARHRHGDPATGGVAGNERLTAMTGHRFARYYTGSVLYDRRGPPGPLMRVLGPLAMMTRWPGGLLLAAATAHLAARWEAIAPVDVPLGRLEQAHWYIDGLGRPGQGVISTVRDSV
jgi:hypothetical protein